MAVYEIYGKITFPNRQQRDRANTTIQNEAATRGLTAHTRVLEGQSVTGTWAGVQGGINIVLLCYRGDYTTVETAYNDIYAWLEANGMDENSYAGYRWISA